MTYKEGNLTEMRGGASEEMILCFSGGIDSLIAWHYLGKPKSVFFHCTDYSTIELSSALRLNQGIIIDRSLSLSKIQEGDNAYIPHRNLLFASIASNYGSTVVIAGLKDDMVEDKNPKAFNLMSEVLSATSKKDINVLSPFWGMTKAEIVAWFLANVPDAKAMLGISVSCYAGEANCGMCPSCFRKACALWENDIKTHFRDDLLMRHYYNRALQWKYDEARCRSIIKFVQGQKEWQ